MDVRKITSGKGAVTFLDVWDGKEYGKEINLP